MLEVGFRTEGSFAVSVPVEVSTAVVFEGKDARQELDFLRDARVVSLDVNSVGVFEVCLISSAVLESGTTRGVVILNCR